MSNRRVLPNEKDVLFGRGFTISAHPGNQKLRQIVDLNKASFAAARKKEKRSMAGDIVQEIQSSHGGRFLMEDPTLEETEASRKVESINDKIWVVVDTERAVDKVMHRLREKERPKPSFETASVSFNPEMLSEGGMQVPSQLFNLNNSSASPSAANVRSGGAVAGEVETIQQQLYAQQLISRGVSPQMAVQLSSHQSQIMGNPLMGQQHQLGPQHIGPQQLGCESVASQGGAASQQDLIRQQELLTRQLAEVQARQERLLQLQRQQVSTQCDVMPVDASWLIGDRRGMPVDYVSSAGMPDNVVSSNVMGSPLTQSMQGLKDDGSHGHANFSHASWQDRAANSGVGGIRQVGISHLEDRGDAQVAQRTNTSIPENSSGDTTSGGIGRVDPLLGTQMTLLGQNLNKQRMGQEAVQWSGQEDFMSNPKAADIATVSNKGNFGSSSITNTLDSTASSVDPCVYDTCADPPSRQPQDSLPVTDYINSLESVDDIYSGRGDAVETMERVAGTRSSLLGLDSMTRLTSTKSDVDSNIFLGEYSGTQCTDLDLNKMVDSSNDNSARELVEGQDVSLRQWIKATLPKAALGGSASTGTQMKGYLPLAIEVAIKLLECLIAHEKAGGYLDNPVPLSQINCGNICIKPNSEGQVESVRLESLAPPGKVHDNPMERLFAFGSVMYELLSSEPLDWRGSRELRSSIQSLDLADSPSKQGPDRLRYQSSTSVAAGDFSRALANLEFVGVPQSLIMLLTSLLDCSRGDFADETAYKSYLDVKMDLKLMQADPTRFLDNLMVDTSNPTFVIRDRLYGRSDDIAKIERSYQQHCTGSRTSGIVVTGSSGVGKSAMVNEVMLRLTSEANSYYFQAKFDHSNSVNPFGALGSVFNMLCEAYSRDCSPNQVHSTALELESALGSQVAILADILPSLTNIVNVQGSDGSATECVDRSATVHYSMRKMLEVISRHSKRMTLALDDLQWADPNSLRVITSLLEDVKDNGKVFFVLCYRDDESADPFSEWFSSIKGCPLEIVSLENISASGVNELLSETMHLPPRLTRTLASALTSKTQGNPLFVRQLLEVLREQKLIYIQLRPLRWMWDIDSIVDLEVSDDVVQLLLMQMERLPAGVRYGLKVASCLGSSTKYSVFDILSKELNVNLRGMLIDAVTKGYMIDCAGGRIQFSHDKVKEAAYEMMTVEDKIENHMNFGLILCSSVLENQTPDNETFFLAVNQLNSGDGCSLSDPSKRLMFATLNLKAGRRAIDLCDYNSALKLLESGMSLLPDDHWKSEYNLSLQMYRVAVDTACTLNNAAAVTKFSQEILTNVEAPLEKLHALFCVMKCLRTASKIQESQQLSYSILQQLGESLPRERGDSDLLAEIDSMRTKVLNMPDESIINMKESTRKEKDMLLLGLYSNLIVVMNDQNPKRMDDICLRMMEITVVNGLCALSPLSVALFALVLVSTGDIELAYRLGRLALRLTEKANGQRFLSEVAFFVGGCVSWVSEPLQSVAETNLLGYTNGQQVGDVLSALSNYQFYSLAIYLSGKNLKFCRDTSRKVSESLMQRHYLFLYKQAVVVYRQTAAFIGDVEGEEERPGNFPSWDDLMTHPERSANIDFSFYIQAHLYMRIFILTRDFTNLPNEGLLVRLTRKQTPMRPILWVGVFFEGLVSFHLARLLDDSDYYQQGEAALAFISKWRNSCNNKCNFENKYMVLEAMRLDLKDPDQAEDFYLKAVKSSKENRFVHEEGIASELSGDFYHRRGNIAKSYSFYRNAMECYGTWGANAVTQRLKEDVLEKFDSRQIIAQPIEKYISAVGYGEEPISTTRKRAE